jgi:hypothetical protein
MPAVNEPSETIPIEETVKRIIHDFRFKRMRYMVEHPESITDENLFPDDLSRHAEAVAIVRAVRDDAALTAGEIERLRAECEEQARLNGMGAERELGLRAALQAICDYHIPDQPETADGDSLSWAYQQHAHLRRIALRALKPIGHTADD